MDAVTMNAVFAVTSISLLVVWTTISLAYREFPAARWWSAGLVLILTAGVLSPNVANSRVSLVAVIPSMLMAVAFWLGWIGIERFEGRTARLRWPLFAVTGNLVVALAVYRSPELAEINGAIALVLPTIASAYSLVGDRRPGVGQWVAAAGLAVGIATHIATIAGAAARLTAYGSDFHFSSAGGPALICLLLSGLLFHLGLLTMSFESVRRQYECLASLDPLTGLYNRRKFEALVAQQVMRADSSNSGFSVVLFDLDEFKQLNDQFGHHVGDEALVQFARILADLGDESDLTARLGGDEFVALLPGASESAARGHAEAVRTSLAEVNVKAGGRPVSLDVSYGVASWSPQESDLADLMRRADRDLYADKMKRRDHGAAQLTG